MARPDLSARVLTLRAARIAAAGAPAPRAITRRDGVRMEVDGRWLTAFCSSDYLGLGQQFGVVNALQDAAAREGSGSGAASCTGGRHQLHEALEREVADWLGYPGALLFASPYLANLAVQQALLCEEGDVCVQDQFNHASLLDATALAGARLRRYPHRDSEGAMRQLRHAPEGAAMLATDAIFGQSGDVAPLRSLSLVARMQEAVLYVDDAHGIGTAGGQGRGSVAAAGLGLAEVPLQNIPLDTALGGAGAVVVGDASLIGHLVDTSRPYRHAAALPPALAAASLEALRLARRDDWRRDKLIELVALFRGAARRHGLELTASETAIQPVPCASEHAARGLSQALENAGWWVQPTCLPGPSSEQAAVCIRLTALHAPEQVQGLVEALALARDASHTLPVTAA